MTYRVRSTDIWHSMPGVVAAYQPIGAPSETEARFNIGAWQQMVGNYSATPGTAPTWSVALGWTFNGSTQYLKTGIVPNDATSMLVRLSANIRAKAECVIGVATNSSWCLIIPNNGATATVQYLHGNASTNFKDVAPQLLNGIAGIAGKICYRNGIAEGTIPAGSGTYGTADIYIGDYNNNGTPGGGGYFFTGNIQSAVIYSRTLTPAEVWQASMQMKYCDVNPAWNAWAPRKRYYISASPAIAGSVGIYGARATMALPGGVSIRATGGQT